MDASGVSAVSSSSVVVAAAGKGGRVEFKVPNDSTGAISGVGGSIEISNLGIYPKPHQLYPPQTENQEYIPRRRTGLVHLGAAISSLADAQFLEKERGKGG